MPAKWTADLLGKMHLAGITAKQLAAEVGWNPKYLSVVLNGHKEPKGAEEKLNAAFNRIREKENMCFNAQKEARHDVRRAKNDG